MDCKQETPFRIGGHYRQQNGVVAEVTHHYRDMVLVRTQWAPEGKQLHGGGGRRLSDGKYVNWFCADDDKFTLIPGELTQTPSGWVALGAEKQEDDIKPHGSRQGDLIHRGGREYVRAGNDFRWYSDLPEGAEDRFFAGSAEIERLVVAAECAHLQRELRKGEPTSADLAMILRDETDEARHYAKKLAFCARVAQMAADRAPSTAKPNPFPNTLRSPDCSSVPDHLNASRHQMAGMKG